MSKKSVQALKRAESELAEVPSDQRAELLRAANIGSARQARALARAFTTLEQASVAEDSIKVGKGGNGRMVRRPNWLVRVSASRTLLEWLAPVVKASAAHANGKTTVNVNVAGYASGEATVQPGVVIDVKGERVDS